MGYIKDTISGISWMSLLRGVTRGIAFLRISILARLLDPIQFGLFGIASLMLGLLEIVTETGINVFLIQEQADLQENINTAYLVSIVRGIIVSTFLIITSPLVALFFKSPQSINLLLLLSIVPFIRGFINPAVIKFQKNLQFNKEFIFRTILYSIDAIVSISIGVITHNAISLVYGMLVSAIAETVFSWVFIKPRPRWIFEKSRFTLILHRGKWVTIYGFINYLYHNGDDFIVGRILNTSNLGIYQIAYKLATLPTFETGEIFGRVTFPIYSKIVEDKRRLKNAFIKVSLGIIFIITPLCGLIYFYAHDLVLIIFGNKWIEAIPLVRILIIFSLINSISGSVTPLFLALKKQNYITWYLLAGMSGMAISIFPLVINYGLVGAAWSTVIGSLISVPVIIYFIIKIFKLENI
jgi:O-antigen/teichoic acid export membrane protein